MPNIDVRKLNLVANKATIRAEDKRIIKDAVVGLKAMQVENEKLKVSLKSESELKKNAVVKAMLVKEKNKLAAEHKLSEARTQKSIALKAQEIAKLKKEMAELKRETTAATKLKQNSVVKSLLATEKKKFSKILSDKDAKIAKISKDLQVLETKPIGKAKFNQFMAESVLELQQSFQSAKQDQESEIIIRDVEIEASVITEMKAGKPVHIVPSRKDMQTLDSSNFQRIKYLLSIIPKE